MSKILSGIYVELGLKALVASPVDVKILCLQRLVRLYAYGSSTLVLTLFLTALGHSAQKAGLFMTLTLLGDVVISLLLTVVADRIGRRRMLALGSLLMTASGAIFATFSQYWILVLASIFGVISPSGNEIGPFRAIEESTLSQLVNPVDRSSVLAWYTLCGPAGAALGSISMGWVVDVLQYRYRWETVESYRLVFWVYGGLGLIKFALSLLLSNQCEARATQKAKKAKPDERRPLLEDASPSNAPEQPVSKTPNRFRSLLPELSSHTIGLIVRLCLLFALDSLGSGIASTAWLVYFFHEKFGLDEGTLGSLFFVTNILSSISNLAAASLARRIGLVKTMVFTHLPASAALTLLPVPNNQIVAMALLIARSSITSMDTAPRQAFLAAAVLPEERTIVMGIVNVCKTLSQAGGPTISGVFAGIEKFGIALVIAGSLKCSYDILMMVMFLGYKTVEEKAAERVEEEVETEREAGRGQTLSAP